MEDIEKEILRYPLYVLKWSGQNPNQGKASFYLVVALNTFFSTILLVLIGFQLVYANGNIIAICRNLEGLCIFGQTICKSIVTAIKLDDFRKMLEQSKNFWSLQKSKGEDRIELENTYARVLKLEKFFTRLVFLGLFGGTVTAYFAKQLPAGVWTMGSHGALYNVTLILQAVLVQWAGFYSTGYDSLFLSFCIQLKAQFKMLHNSFEGLNVSNILNKSDEIMYFNKLKSYIKHHEFLLRYSKIMREAYSPVMLTVHVSLHLFYLVEMYVLFESTAVALLVRHSAAMIAALMQLAFYCIPLNYITDEAVSVAEGIYNSNWFSKKVPTLRTMIPLIIQRSQREIIFRAGGLTEMKCTTLISVVRISYSVCSILRALKNV